MASAWCIALTRGTSRTRSNTRDARYAAER
jgi:hypothetical protein